MLPDLAFGVCLCFILLIPFAGAGLSLINTGLNRSRNAAHAILCSLCIAAVAVIAFFVCGFAWQGTAELPSHVVTAAGRTWNWISAGPFFLRGVNFDGSAGSLIVLMQLFSVALASMIPAASGAERWRLSASCVSTALLAGWMYPLFAHWVWGGGWLAQLDVNYGLGRGFTDPGGASCIHIVGGLTALSIAWILGPRRGKFTPDGAPTAMPGHNAVIVSFGCMLTLLGFFGLNSAGSILFAGQSPAQAVLVDVNTTLCAAAAGIAALITTRVRFGRPDASLTANGWVSGLVASSAVCAFVRPAQAVVIGIVAGVLVMFAVEVIELRMKVDDPAGAISMHAVGGIWGILALGIFGQFLQPLRSETTISQAGSANTGSGQFLAQLIGAATLLGFVLPLTYGVNWLLDQVLRQRVSLEGERQGMDLFELGAGAYPEFITHGEDLTRR
jgi:ammonium transporter, Amt family